MTTNTQSTVKEKGVLDPKVFRSRGLVAKCKTDPKSKGRIILTPNSLTLSFNAGCLKSRAFENLPQMYEAHELRKE
jgi:hypothetical protein